MSLLDEERLLEPGFPIAFAIGQFQSRVFGKQQLLKLDNFQ